MKRSQLTIPTTTLRDSTTTLQLPALMTQLMDNIQKLSQQHTTTAHLLCTLMRLKQPQTLTTVIIHKFLLDILMTMLMEHSLSNKDQSLPMMKMLVFSQKQ